MATKANSPANVPRQFSRTEAAQQRMNDGYRAVEECITEHPAASVATIFAVGFGIGMMIGYMLAEPPELSRTQRWMQSFGRHLPESLSRHMQA